MSDVYYTREDYTPQTLHHLRVERTGALLAEKPPTYYEDFFTYNETEDENSKSNAVNNNHIVVVTYGDRDSETFEKTPYKSIILNYNSYAVRVTYNNTIYTVPSGGYIVIDYD